MSHNAIKVAAKRTQGSVWRVKGKGALQESTKRARKTKTALERPGKHHRQRNRKSTLFHQKSTQIFELHFRQHW